MFYYAIYDNTYVLWVYDFGICYLIVQIRNPYWWENLDFSKVQNENYIGACEDSQGIMIISDVWIYELLFFNTYW